MQTEGWTVNDPMAPNHVKNQWEIPDLDSFPEDAAWANPYGWDVATQAWVSVPASSYATHQAYLDAKATF